MGKYLQAIFFISIQAEVISGRGALITDQAACEPFSSHAAWHLTTMGVGKTDAENKLLRARRKRLKHNFWDVQ